MIKHVTGTDEASGTRCLSGLHPGERMGGSGLVAGTPCGEKSTNQFKGRCLRCREVSPGLAQSKRAWINLCGAGASGERSGCFFC